MNSKHKKITGTAAVVLVLVLGLAGTFAASGSTESPGDIEGNVDTSIFLHDDFSKTWQSDVMDRDVYVENTGDTSLYVRMRLDEFMTYGGKKLVGGDKDQKSTWKPHVPAGTDASECGTEIHDYFTLQMGNDAGIKYKTQTKNAYDPAITDADKTKTTSAANIMLIEDYLNAETKPDACWVIDTADGYAYWHTQLKKGDATGLILNSITNTGLIDESYYYGINAKAEAVTETDLSAWFWGQAPKDSITGEAFDQASTNAVRLLKNMSPKYIEITDDMNIGTKASDFDSNNDGYLSGQEYQEYVSEVTRSNTVNTVNFPDKAFKDYISANIDSDNDNFLSADEIASVTSMNLSNQQISDLTGIDKFAALTDLNISGNSLTKLDLSRNTALTTVDASGQNPTVEVTYSKEKDLFKSDSNLFSPGTTLGDTANVSFDNMDQAIVLSSYISSTTFSTPVVYGKEKAAGVLSGTVNFHTTLQKQLEKAKAGQTVLLENKDGTATSWILLNKKNGNAEMITKDAVTLKPYHNANPYPGWKDSDLRSYLKDTYKGTLGGEMQMLLKEEELQTPKLYSDWNAADTSKDFVYLLTQKGADSSQIVTPSGTELTEEQLKCSTTTLDGQSVNEWWLRSPRPKTGDGGLINCTEAIIVSRNVSIAYGLRPSVTVRLK